MNNGSLNGHAERTKLAAEVQAEALRPTPPLNGGITLQQRLSNAEHRVRELESRIAQLQHQKRVNENEAQRDKARMRRELGIEDL